MSVESITKVLNLSDDRLTPIQRLVLIGVANHDGDGGAWPSKATLARYAGTNQQTVRRALRALEGLGYIVTHINEGGRRDQRSDRRPNRYDLHLDHGGASKSPRGDDGGAIGAPDGGCLDEPTGGAWTNPEPSLNHPEEPPLLQGPTDDVTTEVNQSEKLGKEEDQIKEWFDKFWGVYPRKTGKKAAVKAFKAALRKHGKPAVSTGLGRWLAYWKEHKTAENFIPHASTWLNREDFLDPTPTHRQDRDVHGEGDDGGIPDWVFGG
jgi:hypothetical protein